MSARVITLDAEETALACRKLESLCGGWRPDLIVGIAKGGVEIADRIFFSVPHCVIENPRSHQGVKGRWLSKLPVWLLDAMRILEVRLRRRRPIAGTLKLSEVVRCKAASARRILVVDDAVDSGATLQSVLTSIREAAPEAEVKSAVLTVTRSNPLVSPDFRCFPESTLLRFPWSLDAKR